MTRWLLLVSTLSICACQRQVDYDPGTPPRTSAPPAAPAASSAEVVSVRISEGEVREGMRRARVQLRIAETPPRQLTITEWVPVVLLGRLAPGANVRLVRDPVADRLTFSL